MAKEAGFFGRKPAYFGQKKPALAKEAGFRPESRLLQGQSRLTPAYSRLLILGTRKSRLTPAYSRLLFWPGKKPAFAGFRRLPSVAPKEEPAFWPKAGSFGQKAGFFGQKRSRLTPASRRLLSVGRHGEEPAKAGESRLLLWPERSRLTPAEAGSSLAGKKPAYAGSRRLPFRGAQRMSPAKSTSPPSRDKRGYSAPERCHIWAPFCIPRRKCGKHSYGAQRFQGSRRKPAFLGFPGCREAGFCRLRQFWPEPAKRGPYYLRWCRTSPRRPRGPPRALFLTAFGPS